MKKTTIMSLLAVIMFFMAFPAQVCAKKIKFGQYVVYSGKVENGMPKGEGELTIVNNDPNCKKGAFFKGVFDGYTISGELDLKKKGYYPSFSGRAKLEIAADGSYVKVNIISGSLTASIEKGGIGTIGLYKNDSVSIVCTPTEQGIIFSSSNTFEAERKYTNTQETKFSPDYTSNRALYNELNFLDYGSQQSLQGIKWYGHSTYMLNKSGRLVQKEYYESIKLPKFDATLNLYEDGVQQIDFDNGDFFRYEGEQVNRLDRDITGFSVKVQYKEFKGKLCRKNRNEILKFITDNGEEYLALECNDNGSLQERHVGLIERQRLNPIAASDINLGNLTLYKDAAAEAAKKALERDPQGMYDLGMAYIEGNGVAKDEKLGEAFIDKAFSFDNADAKAYMARKEAEAAAKVAEEKAERKAYMASKGINLKEGESEEYVTEQFRLAEQGDLMATLKMGICYEYGICLDKDMTKAFRYYKKASESTDEKIKMAANFFMGFCYWNGKGIAKNQSLAFKYLDDGRKIDYKSLGLSKPDYEKIVYSNYYLGLCYEKGIGTAVYIDRAVDHYEIASFYKENALSSDAYAKIADAYYRLGYWAERAKYGNYYPGIPNRQKARYCYEEALKLGNKRAISALNRL